MHLTMLLEMAADAFGDRTAFGPTARAGSPTPSSATAPGASATWASERGVERVGLVDVSSDVVPTLTFRQRLRRRAVRTGQLPPRRRQAAGDPRPHRPVGRGRRRPGAGPGGIDRRCRAGAAATTSSTRSPRSSRSTTRRWPTPTSIAVLLFTSGTTGEPKAAVLRHRHLTSYVIGTVEFMGADEDEAALVSVPPYHIAGISAVLIGRLRRPADRATCRTSRPTTGSRPARDEAVTQAMVVPTMLGPHPRRARARRRAPARRCATSPTAAAACRSR